MDACAFRHPHLTMLMLAELERHAQFENQTDIELDAIIRRFYICDRLGLADSMTDILQEALQKAENKNLCHHAGRIILCIARKYFFQANYLDAIRAWARCLEMSMCNLDGELGVESLIGFAQVYDQLKDAQTAERFYLQAETLLSDLRLPRLRCQHMIYAATNYLARGDQGQAQALFETSRQLAIECQLEDLQAQIYLQLAIQAVQAKEWSSALKQLDLSLRLARRNHLPHLQCLAHLSLGHIYVAQGHIKPAFNAFSEALFQAECGNLVGYQIESCQNLSKLYEDHHLAVEALKFARRERQLSSKISALAQHERLMEVRAFDHTSKPPVELLLDLSSDSVLEEKSLEEATQTILQASLRILRIDIVFLYLKETRHAAWRCAAISGSANFKDMLGRYFEEAEYPLYFGASKNLLAPVAVHDIRLHPAARELDFLFGKTDLQSMMDVSVRLHGNQIGFISFGTVRRQRNWGRDELLFASHVATLVQQVFGHEEFRQAQSQLEHRVEERTQELQQQTELLQEAHKNIYQLSELGRELTGKLDRDAIMSTLYQHVNKLMPSEAFSIGIYRPETGVIDFPCNIVRGTQMLAYQRDMQNTNLLSTWCVRHKKEIYINVIQAEYHLYMDETGLQTLIAPESYPDQLEIFLPNSFIYVPLLIKDRILGLISVQSAAPFAFERVHVDMLTTLAAYTAVAFDNADTYQQLSSAQQLLMSKEKLAALGALVAGIAHEINTPLGNSLLTASALKERSLSFKAQVEEGSIKRSTMTQFIDMLTEANEILCRNLHNASELVSSFKQVSVDQTSQQKRRFNLLKTSQEIVRTLQVRIQKQGHQFNFEIDEALEIENYPGPYGQVITNLINNALIHGFEDGQQGQLTLRAEVLDASHLKIIFSDNGKGIKPEHLRRVFDPFFTTKLGQGGSGLGLNIVHNIVSDLLGGSIQIESTWGAGTHISIVLGRV